MAGPPPTSGGSAPVARPSTGRRERRGLIGPFTGRQLLAAAVTVLLVAVGLVVVTTPLGTTAPIAVNDPQATQYILDPNAKIGVRPGEIPPPLAVTQPDGTTAPIRDLQGNPVDLTALRGKAVWLNFWASWCPPCQSETPVLRDLADAYRDRGLVVVGISVQESSPENVAAYAQRYQLGYVIAADSTGEIYRRYSPRGIPTSIFIGPEGAVRSYVLAPLTAATARAQIEAILPGAPSASAAVTPSAPAVASSTAP